MNRTDVEQAIKVAGYHGDSGKFTRLYIDNRISHGRAMGYFRAGQKAKERGVKCSCKKCKEEQDNDL